jgi:16S rRNA (guanine527-N7)-methyltransferase
MPDKAILSRVSRETIAALKTYEALVLKWTTSINLIAPSTRGGIWSRHIEDSAQVVDLIPPQSKNLVDFGSGAGFPALVVAILAREVLPSLEVTCLESDQRKCAFLRAVARETGVRVRVLSERIESAPVCDAEVATARAVAPVVDLLGFAERHRHQKGTCLFLKGGRARNEVSEAQKLWQFQPQYHPSKTDPDGCVIEIGEFSRV